MLIATSVNHEGVCAEFYETTKIQVFSSGCDGQWKKQSELDVDFQNKPLRVIRDSLVHLLSSLISIGCREIVFSEVKGFPLSIMEGLQFRMWQATGNPLFVLDKVKMSFEHHQKTTETNQINVDSHFKTEVSGVYEINLVDAMTQTKMNSRDILIPFLERESYQQLIVLCDHQPKWMKTCARYSVVQIKQKGIYQAILIESK